MSSRPELISSQPITGTRAGRPDYSGETYRSKQIFGYVPEFGEIPIWMLLIACPPDRPAGASACTMNAIAPGAEIALIDCFQGTPYHTSQAGWDYIIKEFWIGFNQRSRFTMYQPGFAGGDTACLCYAEAFDKPVNLFTTGWTRSLLENIAVGSRLEVYVRNEGTDPMYGKIWVTGYEKLGSYLWL